jgi:ribosomal-protein-alanine N-acetyltransferase
MLRNLKDTDIPDLVALEIATQESPWSEDIFNKCIILGSQGWVLEVDQRVIGFVLFLSRVGEGHILNICVHPDYQHQGYGRLLMDKVMAIADDEKLIVVYLEVRVSNRNAIQLYEKMGFKQLGVRKGYYPLSAGREDGLVFAKDLMHKE